MKRTDFTLRRLQLPSRCPIDDTGIRPLQPLDDAAWIWHPDAAPGQPSFVRFRCVFTARPEPLVIHLTADQNYSFLLDGALIGRGPDRSDVQHWSYASYQVRLKPGRHTMEVLAWNVGELAPIGHISHAPGFTFKAEGVYDEALTTGRAPWRARLLKGWRMECTDPAFQVQNDFHLDLNIRDEDEAAPLQVASPLIANPYGVVAPGWQLHPSQLPEQGTWPVPAPKVVAAGVGTLDADRRLTAQETSPMAGRDWTRWLKGSGSHRIPAGFDGFVLLDMDDFYCLYPELTVSGGAGSCLRLCWAESLFDASGIKGDRDAVVDKFLCGPSDYFYPDGGAKRRFERPWFRAGRYVLLHVRTAEQPLTLHRLTLTEVRYAWRARGYFRAPDPGLKGILRLCQRGLEASMHSCFLDSPFHEQMMYVGDLRVQLLSLYALSDEDRFARRCIELFDYSRSRWGLVQERYPSRTPQMSPTYTLIWGLILRDYAWWRSSADGWLAERLASWRGQLEQFDAWRQADGLLAGLPGWCFVDWVEGWKQGMPPEARGGVSSLINLHYLLALEATAELEELHHEPLLARRWRERAAALRKSLRASFWDASSGLLANRPGGRAESEHAQVLGLLAGVFHPREINAVLKVLESEHTLSRCSYYFSHYLFDVFARFGRTEALARHLTRWQVMVDQGLRAPIEAPEPARSDCHGWSSHPVFHMAADVAGIRPGEPGFRSVRVAPVPGPWPDFSCAVPHPGGDVIRVEVRQADQRIRIHLPPGVPGTLVWRNRARPLRPGDQEFPFA
jgi:hypothetical protein